MRSRPINSLTSNFTTRNEEAQDDETWRNEVELEAQGATFGVQGEAVLLCQRIVVHEREAVPCYETSYSGKETGTRSCVGHVAVWRLVWTIYADGLLEAGGRDGAGGSEGEGERYGNGG